MEHRSVYEFAGDLNKELVEFKKSVSDKERMDERYSTTAKCMTILTLYCC